MIDLPKGSIDEMERFADWAEICAFLVSQGSISHADVAETVKSSSLVGGADEDLPPGDETFLDAFAFANTEALANFTERIWQRLDVRATLLGDKYPYTLVGDRLVRRVE